MRATRKNKGIVRYTVAYFDNEDDLVDCILEVRKQGAEIYDVFTPYPVHGLDLATGERPTKLTWVIFAGGVLGLLTAIGMQMYVFDYDWPVNLAGKPFAGYPLFVPISFELTVLFSGLTAVFAFFANRRLYPFSKRTALPGVTDNRFALVVEQSNAAFDYTDTLKILRSFDPLEIVEGADLV